MGKRSLSGSAYLPVVGAFGGWVAIAAVAGSTGGPTTFGRFSFMCGAVIWLGCVLIQVVIVVGALVARCYRKGPK